ncbi:hypothetical protein CcaverHIS002_0701130 [Cutaneotrichosporon cavernicola]|nr:hypothetical protein CcaverHIS002_0701130 [Cutaneotrichosporon cavernicola]
MGVKGLWSLLNPVARPVQIESLEGKRLAIDSSIWLYQFQSTMRDQDGRVLVNAHVLGFLRRINRLLFHGIKPVFVFDGGAPALKRSTITERKRRKLGAAQSHTKMAEKLLHAQMRRAAVMLAQEADERRAARIGARADGILEESEAIPENAVYLDELEGRPAARPVTTQISAASTSEPPKKKYKRDRYELPEADMPTYSTEERPDARLATEEELKHFIEEVGPTDIDVESPEFRALPTEVQYEIIGDLRVRSRQQSHARLTAMLKNAPTALDFSKAQIKHLSQRNALTQQLLTVTDSVGKAHLTIPVRVASERNREYVLVKRSQDDGGGWALGIRDGTKDKPIELEPETENDRRIRNAVERRTVRDEDSDSDSSVEEIKPTEVDKDLREHRRREVLEAITQRYAPKKQDDDPAPTRRKKNAVPLFDIDEDIMPTAHDEALALALQQEELGSEEDEPDANLARALALSRKKTPSSPPPLPPSSDDDEFEEVELIPSTHVSRANSVYEPIEISSDEEAPPLKNVPAPMVVDDSDDDLEPTEPPDPRRVAGSSFAPNTANGAPSVPRPSVVPLALSRLRYEVHEDSDEEDDAIEWSRSPSPVLRKDGMGKPLSALASTLGETQPDEASGLTSGHVSDYASEAEMDAEDMVAEEDEYARFLAQIQNRDLAEVRTEIDDEIRILNQQTKAAMRDSDEITQSMVVQIQTLLRHFGIPYITAPMEAEAQCAKLAELGLVEGIITDDSDVFLFGGSTCFKNIFNDAKYAECYAATDIERELSLPRHRLIELAYLLGSDYTIGILGVGPVMSLELLANFPGNSSLQRFKEWWATVQVGKDDVTTETKWMRSFKKRFAGTLELGGDWPNPLVRDAYNHPQTDESDEPFCWGFPRLAALRTFLHEELSWSISKVDDELTPIVQRIAARGRGAVPRQGTLLPFFDHSAAAGSLVPRRRTTANISKRLLSVIKEFREAEARAAGQDPHGWGEMLAGVDESDPRGTKDGQKEVKKGRSKGEKQEAEVGKDGNKPKTRKAPAKRVKKSNGKEKKDQEGENEATGDGTAEWTVTTRKAPTRRAKRASKSMAEDSEEEAPAPTKRRKKASKAEED